MGVSTLNIYQSKGIECPLRMSDESEFVGCPLVLSDQSEAVGCPQRQYDQSEAGSVHCNCPISLRLGCPL
jgi:hypothetical protein